MADFPTLSVSGPVHPFAESFVSAGELVSPTDGGYKITRRMFTRRTKEFSMRYYPLTDADKLLLDAHIDTHGTTGNFNWTHPLTAAVHDVRFVKIPKPVRQGIHWAMDCELEEV